MFVTTQNVIIIMLLFNKTLHVALFFKCTPADQTSDSLMVLTKTYLKMKELSPNDVSIVSPTRSGIQL